ncbi:hypothetical protein [Maritalea sp.]|uniref:hypothetical protein n=1 Tax=Maritalea sp. TaxID=2003361 RepID=UPI003EF63D3D
MKKLNIFTAFLVVLLTFSGTALAGQFPSISAKNLNEVKMNLPGDFGARRSIVMIAYSQKQQDDVNTWLPFLQQAAKKSGVKFYETPVISSGYGLMSGFINNGMRSGITSKSTRAKTITLFTNVGTFNRKIGVSGTNTIHAVVIDKNGKVLETVSGTYSKAKGQKINAAL